MIKIPLRQCVFPWLFSILLAGAQAGLAQTLPINGYNTLAQALGSGITTITNFSTNGTVTIHFSASGSPAFNITTNITIDAGTNSVIFQGDGTTRFFYVHPNATLTLNNLALTNGFSTNGGAILNSGRLIISNCLFAGNVATNTDGAAGGNGPPGGGNGTNGGPGGTASGGAIYSTGAISVFSSIFTNNYALAGNGGNGGTATGGLANGGAAGYGGNAYGGAIYNTGATNIFYLTEFVANQCRAGNGGTGGYYATNAPPYSGSGGATGLGGSCGGGALLLTGSLWMNNCLVANNFAVAGNTGAAEMDSNGGGAEGSPGGEAEGGGIYLAQNTALAIITNSTIYTNASYGGAGGLTSLNAATGGDGGPAEGGGIWSAASTVRMSFCTVANNYVSGGMAGTNTGGGFSGVAGAENGWDILRSTGSFQMSDSILDSFLPLAEASTNYPNAVGVTDEGYNICSDGSLSKNTTLNTSRLNTDPQLGFLENLGPLVGGIFGGPMYVAFVPTNSPAAGFIPGVPGLTFPAVDQILQDRGTPTSAGAYEALAIAVQTNAVLPQITGISPAGITLTGNGGAVTYTATVNTAAYSNANILPFGYQWQLNGTNISNGANYSGATSDVLTIKNISINNEGYYTLIASPTVLEGFNTNTNVELVLTNLPMIKAQPVSQLNRPSGSQVAFIVNVEGASGFNYQWLFDGANLPNSPEYQVDGNILIISPATAADAGTYSVVISNAFNPSAVRTSSKVQLTIVNDNSRPSLTITSPAANVRTNYLVMTGTAQDNAQVKSVQFWITNINGALGANLCANGYAILTTNGNTNLNAAPNKKVWAITATPWPGTNILAVQAMDYSSNVSPILTRKFFYEVPGNFTLNIFSNGGGGTVTGHAFIHKDVAPTNTGAPLNIGEGYSLVASPNSASLLGAWTNQDGNSIMVTNGNTLTFIMQSNTTISADFVSNIYLASGIRGTYNGLFYGEQTSNQIVTNGAGANAVVSTNLIVSNLVSFDSAGMLNNLVLSKNGSFTAKLLVAGGSYKLDGSFNGFGRLTNQIVTRSGTSPLFVSMDLNTNGAGTITGTVSNESWPSNSFLWADLAATTSGTSNFTALLLPPTNGSPVIGDGYALIQDHNGSVSLTGGLADGTIFSESVSASQDGFVPVYASLYDKTGFLLGWINLTNLNSSNSMDGLTWINGTTTNVLQTEGGVWTNPGAITLPANEELLVTNASLNLDYTVGIVDNNKIVNSGASPANSLAGTINLKTGQLVVNFGNGNGNSTTKGYGAMLPGGTNGGGYFATKTTSGLILLQPGAPTTNTLVPAVEK